MNTPDANCIENILLNFYYDTNFINKSIGDLKSIYMKVISLNRDGNTILLDKKPSQSRASDSFDTNLLSLNENKTNNIILMRYVDIYPTDE